MIDLRKAFDLVNHAILLEKLRLYKCSISCIRLFTSYLSDRSQQTQYLGQLSDPAQMSVGVPQGSILGPLLFLLYVNDLHLISSSSSCHMFADDSTFCTSAPDLTTIENNLDSDLSNISQWCSNNLMSLHLGKTKSMLITNRQKRSHLNNRSLNVNFLGTDIECVSSHKLLGVTLDHDLTWKNHCDEICMKVRKKLFLLRKLKKILPQSARLQYYNSFILPHLDYCSNVWFTGQSTVLHNLDVLQKRAMRLILDVPFTTPSIDLYKSLNWMSVQYRCMYNISILVFKSLNSLTPSYLSFFNVNNNNRTRASSRSDLIVPFARKNMLKNSFRIQGAKIYNDLPTSIRDSPTLMSFKRACFKHFISRFNNSL